MTGILLRSQGQTQSSSQKEVFFCPEESHFYSHCLERLLFNHCREGDRVVECGAGDGTPVINTLLRTEADITIYGYELNASACQVAHSNIKKVNLDRRYVVKNQSFFDARKPEARYLIANPPYLPALNNKIKMPLLHGGTDGAGITNRLLSLNYTYAMLLLSSYSNPVGTIDYALQQNYVVADFMLTPLPFGSYSSERQVSERIKDLKQKKRAFCSDRLYLLAGVLFKKRTSTDIDLSSELVKVITAL